MKRQRSMRFAIAAYQRPDRGSIRNDRMLTSAVARTTISPHLKNMVCILAVTLGCLIASEVRSAPKPIPLAEGQRTTLHVGELAVLHIPSDSRYSHSGTDGAWRDVLARVRRSRRDVMFRAVRPGSGVIIISPDVPDGACISCATLHYFIDVVSQE